MKNIGKAVKTILSVLVFAGLIFSPDGHGSAAGTMWYVDDNCSPPTNGSISDPFCTIAEGITFAAADDIIVIASGYYPETLVIGKDLTLQGASEADTFINGDGANSVVTVDSGEVLIQGVTIQGGGGLLGAGVMNQGVLTLYRTRVQDNVLPDSGQGAGIRNMGTLTVDNTLIINNTCTASAGGLSGGGIWNLGTLAVIDSEIHANGNHGDCDGFLHGGGLFLVGGTTVIESTSIRNNWASVHGGGIAQLDGTLTVTDASVRENHVTDPLSRGGGVELLTAATFERVTFAHNSSQSSGGAIDLSAGSHDPYTVNITNATVTGNASTDGGAIYVGSPQLSLNLTHVTLSGNMYYGGSTGGIDNSGVIHIRNSIVAYNQGLGNCVGSLNSDGHNLEDKDTCSFSQVGDLTYTNPMLGPLQDNGGPTQTMALLLGSPAIDAAGGGFCPFTDQRNFPRFIGDGCDIGAFESQFPIGLFLPLIMR